MSAETKVILSKDIPDGLLYYARNFGDIALKDIKMIDYDTAWGPDFAPIEIKKSNINRTMLYNAIPSEDRKKKNMEALILSRCRIKEDPEEKSMPGWTSYGHEYRLEFEGVQGPLSRYTGQPAPNYETSRLWFLIWLASHEWMNKSIVIIYPDPEQKC